MVRISLIWLFKREVASFAVKQQRLSREGKLKVWFEGND